MVIPNLLKIPVNEIVVYSSLRYLIRWTPRHPHQPMLLDQFLFIHLFKLQISFYPVAAILQ
jgi:hypothetical protein